MAAVSPRWQAVPLFLDARHAEQTRVYLHRSLDKTPYVRVLPSDSAGRFAAPDRLLTTAQGALQMYRFDPATGAVQGEPVVVAQGLVGGIGAMAASATGVMAYRTGSAQRRQLVWVDRKGAVLRAIGEPETGNTGSPDLSPDEQSVVVFSGRSGDNDIWVIELPATSPAGSPMARQPMRIQCGIPTVSTSSSIHAGFLVTDRRVKQSTAARRSPSSSAGQRSAVSLTRDRQHLLVRRDDAEERADLVALSVTGAPRRLLSLSPSTDETEGQFSPDGKWVAFVSSDERPSGSVRPVVSGRTSEDASLDGWRRAGAMVCRWERDLLLAPMAADGGRVAWRSAPEVNLPVPLFQTYLATGTNVLGNKPQYAVSRDGRFLLNTAVESPSAPIVVSVNWMKAVK